MTARTIDTGTEDFLAEVTDTGVAIFTMNRPKARNAMSGEMTAALQKCLADAEHDPEIKVIVLTGAGKGFCAGGDVKGMAASQGSGRQTTLDEAIHSQRMNQRATAGKLHEMPKPTIAALPGAAAGAGLGLALGCDLRVMADNAILTTAFARVGFSGDYGGTYFLTKLVGAAKAREMYFLSDRVSADEALRLGLANWVVPADQLMDKTMEIANRLASGPTVAYRYMKENLNRAMSGELNDCLDLEATHHIHTGATEDHKEAAKAFIEKREPTFKGR